MASLQGVAPCLRWRLANGNCSPTRVCSRRLTASAVLPLPGTAETWRSATTLQRPGKGLVMRESLTPHTQRISTMRPPDDRWSRRVFLKGFALRGSLGLLDASVRPAITYAWHTGARRSLFAFMDTTQRDAIIRGEVVDSSEALRRFFADAVVRRGGTDLFTGTNSHIWINARVSGCRRGVFFNNSEPE
jgi:hypothetical protein